MGRRAKEKKHNRTEAVAMTADGREVVARSTARYLHCAPRKVAIVARELRHKTVAEALDILRFTHRPSAVPYIERALKSAVANAENVSPDPYALVIGEIRVEGAPMLKRIQPASMGRAFRVRRRLSHLHIYLTNEDA
ncbi:MAG: 50S ribosomal protein L22 [Candidatus Sumerlaeia bacterium]|nr:50S ribosomal protein L22 [Candidatus Sumerlaeia bacterium]